MLYYRLYVIINLLHNIELNTGLYVILQMMDIEIEKQVK